MAGDKRMLYYITESLLKIIPNVVQNFGTWELANVIQGLGEIVHKMPKNPQTNYLVKNSRPDNFDFVKLVLIQSCHQNIRRFKQLECVRVLHGFALLEIYDTQLSQSMVDIWLQGKNAKIQQQQIQYDLDLIKEDNNYVEDSERGLLAPQVVWSVSKMGFEFNEDQWKIIMSFITREIDRFKLKELCMIVVGMAHQQFHQQQNLLQMLADKIVKKFEKPESPIKPQDVSNVVWSFAVLQFYHEQLTEQIINYSFKLMDKLNAQGISNILWGLSELHVRTKYEATEKCYELFNQIIPFILSKIENFTGQGLTCLNLAYVRLGIINQIKFQKQLIKQIKLNQKNFHPISVPLLLWSLSRLGQFYDYELIESLVQTATKRQGFYGGKELGIIIISLANLRHYNQTFFDKITPKFLQILPQCTEQDISNFVYGLTFFYHRDLDTIVQIQKFLQSQDLSSWTTHALCTCLWSFSVLETMTPEFAKQLITCLNQFEVSEFESEGLTALYHYQLMYRQAEGHVDIIQDLIKGELKAESKNTWRKSLRKRREKKFTKLHLLVESAISKLGLGKVKSGFIINKGPFLVGIAVNCYSYPPIAIEVEVQENYSRNLPYKALGKMHARRRVLERFGWVQVSVPFYDWEKVQTEVGQEYYLLSKIQNALNAVAQ